tara:strand:+ start:1212 stop:2843 length:1632 start_codon:yes stop_codon:yes gene_type:complete
MNSKVLALKYRPKTFNDLIGQEVIANTIYNSIKLDKIPNAFLFHGIRGTGKTSIARIIAKALNCKNGVDNLCTKNFCNNCESIINSSHLDVIEQDCATATGIDSVRDLIEFCRYPPTTGKYKVLILDEIQAMSKAGAQSLLKILEEPPNYVVFIFCTTEIKKILVTIISRCTRFDLSRIKFETLFNYLKIILNKENGKISDDGLKLICKLSEGSLRDALSLLDRALLSKNINTELNLADVQNIFGYFDKNSVILLLTNILEGNETESKKIYKNIYDTGFEPSILLNDILEILYYLKNIEFLKLESSNFDLNDQEFNQIHELSKKVEKKTLIIFWDIIVKSMEQINFVSNPYIFVEMIITKLLYVIGPVDKNNREIMDFDNNLIHSSNTSSNIGEGTVNQIKNLTQKEEIKKSEKKDLNQSNNFKINSIHELINICKLNKEMGLKYDLENNVNLVKFEENRIEISFNENLDKDFVKILSSKLFEWTNSRWIITLSKQKGDASLKESQKKLKENTIDDFKKTEDYKKIIQILDDVEIMDIKETDD